MNIYITMTVRRRGWWGSYGRVANLEVLGGGPFLSGRCIIWRPSGAVWRPSAAAIDFSGFG